MKGRKDTATFIIMACSRRVVPERVIKEVKSELAALQPGNTVPDSLQLSPTMLRSKLRDSTVSLSNDPPVKRSPFLPFFPRSERSVCPCVFSLGDSVSRS